MTLIYMKKEDSPSNYGTGKGTIIVQSMEFQIDNTQMKISWTSLTLQAGSSPHQSYLVLGISPTAPITVWNEDNTKNLAIELGEYSAVLINFSQFN